MQPTNPPVDFDPTLHEIVLGRVERKDRFKSLLSALSLTLYPYSLTRMTPENRLEHTEKTLSTHLAELTNYMSKFQIPAQIFIDLGSYPRKGNCLIKNGWKCEFYSIQIQSALQYHLFFKGLVLNADAPDAEEKAKTPFGYADVILRDGSMLSRCQIMPVRVKTNQAGGLKTAETIDPLRILWNGTDVLDQCVSLFLLDDTELKKEPFFMRLSTKSRAKDLCEREQPI